MMNRTHAIQQHPVKNQETVIDLRGKSYAICTQGQLDFIKMQARGQIAFDAAERREKLTEGELERRLKEHMDNCGYATLEYVHSLMTPAELEDWKNKYRFAPICRTMK